mgnify:CR=1 FL=1
MQYILLTVASKEGFITGVDYLVNNGKPKEPFTLNYNGDIIQQCIFSEGERVTFYKLISLYDSNIIKPLNVYEEEKENKK